MSGAASTPTPPAPRVATNERRETDMGAPERVGMRVHRRYAPLAPAASPRQLSKRVPITTPMSRAFLRDDAEGEMPRRHYDLPERDDPAFERAAARALLEAARVNETQLAERATGFY